MAGYRFLRVVILVMALLGAPAIWTAQPASAAPGIPMMSIVSGVSHSCGVTADGVAFCWGRNASRQLGDGTTTQQTSPTQVLGGVTFSSVQPGSGGNTCGTATNGNGYCWGTNGSGQLGLGGGAPAFLASPSTAITTPAFKSITTGFGYSCGLDTSGYAYCWGQASLGQIGNGLYSSQNVPTAVSGNRTYSSISAGYGHTCAITTVGGTLYCWGFNGSGQLGDGTTNNAATPLAVAGGPYASVSGGANQTCAIDTNSVAYCWGWNVSGQLGDGTNNDQHLPTPISNGGTYKMIATGWDSTCGLRTDGSAYCWGKNTYGGLGVNDTTNRITPTAVNGGLSFMTIDLGDGFACGTTLTGAYCWGLNDQGQLGDGTTTNRSVPTGPMLVVVNQAIQIQMEVVAAMTFAVAGYNSGTCNGATISRSAASSTTVDMKPTSAANAIGGQTLTVSTNSGSGYTVFLRYRAPMANGAGRTFADSGGNNTTPASFSAAGTEAFGYTTDHALSGTSTRFQSNKWAALTTSSTEVAYQNGPFSNDATHVCYQVGVSATTPPSVYTATVVYTAVPIF